MISYEVNTSSFYKANETYCLQIEQLFQTLNATCDGYCNSWGFDLNVIYIKNNISFEFSFNKETVTRKGVIIPEDSAINEWLDVNVSSLNKNHFLKIKKSKFKRLFMSKEFKPLVESPYYFNSNIQFQSQDITNWLSLFEKYDMHLVKLKNGRLEIEISHRVEEPLKLISELEPLLKFYI